MSVPCLACGEVAIIETIVKRDFVYEVCSRCETARLTDAADIEIYGSEYFQGSLDGGYYDYEADKRLHTKSGTRRLDRLARYYAPASVVDVGSAYGYTLDAARLRGIEATGVEISPHAKAISQGRSHRVEGRLEDLETSAFDAVIFAQVLEHMSDPAGALGQAHRVLRDQGIVSIETWDRESRTAKRFGSRWQQISPPSVMHLFSARGLVVMLERQGFDVLEMGPWAKKVSLGGYLGVVSSKLPRGIGTGVNCLAKASRLSRVAIPYRFDDLIAIVARKRTV